jgi:hypothetical protein
VHEGPGDGGGWAAGQGWTGGDPVHESGAEKNGTSGPRPWMAAAIRALNDAVFAALEAGDLAGAAAAAKALAQLLDGA